jgi:serine/threonine protein kinase
LEEVIFQRGQLYLVFEYLDLDLRRYLDHVKAALPPLLIKSYIYQLLLGIDLLHARRHLHRDLKPQNILIDANGTLKIADLGLARAIHFPLPPVTHEVATLWYRAPEVRLTTTRKRSKAK